MWTFGLPAIGWRSARTVSLTSHAHSGHDGGGGCGQERPLGTGMPWPVDSLGLVSFENTRHDQIWIMPRGGPPFALELIFREHLLEILVIGLYAWERYTSGQLPCGTIRIHVGTMLESQSGRNLWTQDRRQMKR